MDGRSGYLAFLLLPLLAACQPEPAGQATAPAIPDVDVAMATPQPPPPADADAFIAENDRAIAENKRMTQALESYRQADGAKFDRVKAGCEQRLGAATDRESAKQVFTCIDTSWPAG